MKVIKKVKNMSKRAKRRHHLDRMKEKAKKVLKGWGNKLTPTNIGTTASVHGAKCSCWMCGNPRKMGHKTQQEKKQDIKDKLDE